MSISKNKVILIVSVGVLLLVIVAALQYGLTYYFEQKQSAQVVNQSTEFLEKWGNYPNNTDTKYLDSIKPYLSDSLFQQNVDDAKSAREINLKYNSPSASSRLVISGQPEVNKQNNKYVVKVAYKQTFEGSYDQNQIATLTWSKIDNNYAIAEISMVNK